MSTNYPPHLPLYLSSYWSRCCTTPCPGTPPPSRCPPVCQRRLCHGDKKNTHTHWWTPMAASSRPEWSPKGLKTSGLEACLSLFWFFCHFIIVVCWLVCSVGATGRGAIKKQNNPINGSLTVLSSELPVVRPKQSVTHRSGDLLRHSNITILCFLREGGAGGAQGF